MANNDNIFSTRLKELLEMNGMSYSDLSKKLGINKSTISMWKKGNVPSADFLVRIASFFNVTPGYLLGAELPKHIESYITHPVHNHLPSDDVGVVNKQVFTQSNTIVIDTHIDESHPFNILQKKVKSGVNLTDEERAQYDAYMTEAFRSVSGSLKRLGQTLEEQYQLLNEAGKKKADEQIDHAVEQVKMLTKIPEYQIEQTMGRIANSFKDGHIRFVKKEDSNTQNE